MWVASKNWPRLAQLFRRSLDTNKHQTSKNYMYIVYRGSLKMGWIVQRIWVFATNLNIPFSLSLQPGGVNLWYFKLRLHDLTEFLVAKIEVLKHQSLWGKLNSFATIRSETGPGCRLFTINVRHADNCNIKYIRENKDQFEWNLDFQLDD